MFQHLMVCYLPPGGVMLYLPEGNHCGGSSGPAWVASSWVWTRPTLSYHPAPTGTADPVLLAGRKRLLHPQKTRSTPPEFLSSIPGGVRPQDRVSLHRATAAATGSRDSRSLARTPNVTTKIRGNTHCRCSEFELRGVLKRSPRLFPASRCLTADG